MFATAHARLLDRSDPMWWWPMWRWTSTYLCSNRVRC